MSQGNWGKLAWEENWVSFLDTMLQFTIISQPNRGLYLPTRLQRAAIDPQALKNFVINNPNVATEGELLKISSQYILFEKRIIFYVIRHGSLQV